VIMVVGMVVWLMHMFRIVRMRAVRVRRLAVSDGRHRSDPFLAMLASQ
jgi:hypothetical protein